MSLPGKAIVFDCEFLTDEGAPQRFWCGPDDPDPTIVQLGAVRLSLHPPFDELDFFDRIIRPRDRFGRPVALPDLFTRLTGITEDRVALSGVTLRDALTDFAAFAGDARCWSWGKDEFNAFAVSGYVEGIAPPMPAARFGNAARLVARAGVPRDEVHKLRSPALPAYFGLPDAGLRAHDALSDARSVAAALRLLMQENRLSPGDFADS